MESKPPPSLLMTSKQDENEKSFAAPQMPSWCRPTGGQSHSQIELETTRPCCLSRPQEEPSERSSALIAPRISVLFNGPRTGPICCSSGLTAKLMEPNASFFVSQAVGVPPRRSASALN